MNLFKPKKLEAGATIAIVSPASPITPSVLENGLAALAGTGFRFRVMPHALERDGFLAGSDRARALDLVNAFADPEVDAVLCSRGGYGCHRLLDLLDFDQMVNSGKPLIGYSDITAIHLAMQRRGGMSYHAPMVSHFAETQEPWVLENWLDLLSGRAAVHPVAPRSNTLVGGRVQGILRGGCLRLVCDAIGTHEPCLGEGTILMLEDVGEKPHRIDAMLTQLLNCGLADQVSGFLIGEMTGTNELQPEIGVMWQQVVRERLGMLGKPVVTDFPIGHITSPLSMALGARVELDADAGTLTYLESTCAE